MDYLKAFVIGGAICMLGQVLIDLTRLTPARILVCYVVLGVILGGAGVYEKLVEFAGAGATVPLTGFGNTLAKGVREAVKEQGILGALTGKQRGIHAVGLAGAHANAGLALGDQNSVGLDALADLPGKLELGHLGVGGLAVGGERKGRWILGHVVDLLHQHAAVDGAQLHLGAVVHAAGR